MLLASPHPPKKTAETITPLQIFIAPTHSDHGENTKLLIASLCVCVAVQKKEDSFLYEEDGSFWGRTRVACYAARRRHKSHHRTNFSSLVITGTNSCCDSNTRSNRSHKLSDAADKHAESGPCSGSANWCSCDGCGHCYFPFSCSSFRNCIFQHS
jgi:hypothetical protein